MVSRNNERIHSLDYKISPNAVTTRIGSHDIEQTYIATKSPDFPWRYHPYLIWNSFSCFRNINKDREIAIVLFLHLYRFWGVFIFSFELWCVLVYQMETFEKCSIYWKNIKISKKIKKVPPKSHEIGKRAFFT